MTAVALVVFLNHFFVVLDQETYAAIDANAFLTREFAPFERRTTVRNDRSYTGIYFYGTNTYFEFFDAGAATNFRKGTDGLAFTPEEPGAIQQLPGIEKPELITRKIGDAQVPWFWAADVKGIPEDSAIDSWVMEYHADFLAEWHPEKGHGESGISRRAILTRYKAVLAEVPAAPHFVDVREITIAADPATIERLTAVHATGVVLHFVPATATKRGIVRVVLEVRDARKQELRLGKSVLRFDGHGRAVWDF
ncbi:MAG TPA: DUF5829 family protein [Thermoanaerobaculia bacterium]|nr:DUF5829 family protein [Thermoanaerobaculia bacterium]